METEKPEKDLMDQLVDKTEVKESKSHDRHVLMIRFILTIADILLCQFFCELRTLFVISEWKDTLNSTVINLSMRKKKGRVE